MPNMTIQIINSLAALMLLLCFCMLMQRRALSLIKILALQGFVLSVGMAIVCYAVKDPHLYISVFMTLLLKVWLIPFVLHKILVRLGVRRLELLPEVSNTLIIGIVLVIIAFNLSLPLTKLGITHNLGTVAIALASVFVSLLILIVKRRAISQVIGFLALENSLFFMAISVTYGMPIIVELGVAFDVLVGLFIFGLFFFQMQESFESFDIHHLEKLRDE